MNKYKSLAKYRSEQSIRNRVLRAQNKRLKTKVKRLKAELKGDLNALPVGHTSRGFGRIEFKDYYNGDCALQNSSLNSPHCVWLGTDRNMMHLTKKMAADLIPQLRYFVKHGEIYMPPEAREAAEATVNESIKQYMMAPKSPTAIAAEAIMKEMSASAAFASSSS